MWNPKTVFLGVAVATLISTSAAYATWQSYINTVANMIQSGPHNTTYDAMCYFAALCSDENAPNRAHTWHDDACAEAIGAGSGTPVCQVGPDCEPAGKIFVGYDAGPPVTPQLLDWEDVADCLHLECTGGDTTGCDPQIFDLEPEAHFVLMVPECTDALPSKTCYTDPQEWIDEILTNLGAHGQDPFGAACPADLCRQGCMTHNALADEFFDASGNLDPAAFSTDSQGCITGPSFTGNVCQIKGGCGNSQYYWPSDNRCYTCTFQ